MIINSGFLIKYENKLAEIVLILKGIMMILKNFFQDRKRPISQDSEESVILI